MARLIPNLIHDSAPPGEKELFATLREQLQQHDWVVMHSLNLPRHLRQNAGEIDFLIMIPGKGILVLEVKSHANVEYKDGLWKLGNDEPTERGPFKQAADAMYSLKKDLPEELTRGVPFTYAVAFTAVRFTQRAAEWQPWQVLDRESLKPSAIVASVLKVVNENRDRLCADLDDPAKRKAVAWFKPHKGEPTVDRIKAICAQLRPNFEIHISPEDQDDRRRGEHKKFLKEQFEALDAMELAPRTLFEGPAGTGKTLLAVEAARRAQSNAGKVLVLCYNRLLAMFLMRELPQDPDNVGTLHRLARNIMGLKPGEDFNTTTLFVDAAAELADSESLKDAFSAIVIDEIQDICSIGALPLVSEVIRQNPNASVRLFGDLENQDIQPSPERQGRGAGEMRKMLQSAIPELVPYSLRKNCRNRPGIGEVVISATGLRDLYSGYRLPPSSQNFEFVNALYPVTETVYTQIIEQLLRSHLPSSIAILSAVGNVPLDALSPAHRRLFTDDDSLWSKDKKIKPHIEQKGLVSTIRKFKGMDAQAVVLVNLPSDLDVPLLYTGISRAIERIVIVCPNELIKKIIQRMGGHISS